MSKDFGLERHNIDGVDVTLVTEQDSELLRASVILPFNTARIQAGTVGYEAPHLLEHVVCCGDGSSPAEDFREQAEQLGGYSNASTSMTINGKLNFETTQPDSGVKQVERMVQAVFSPGFTAKDVSEQKTIVRNELRGYLQNPVRQRMNKMYYDQGLRYTTEPLSLAGLSDITLEELVLFHTGVFTKDNTRIVVSGRPEIVEKIAHKLVKTCIDVAGTGNREFAAKPDWVPLPDYHAAAPEIPEGMTDFLHRRVYEGDFSEDLSISEFMVVANAFNEYLTYGRSGITEQSRNRGLSYGTRVDYLFNRRQVSVAISDTTSTGHVSKQIGLLNEGLDRLTAYNPDHFERFRQKELGRAKLYPAELVGFTKVIERCVASEKFIDLSLPQQYQSALCQLEAPRAVGRIHEIADSLRNASFIHQFAFGENPFSADTIAI